MRLLAQPNTAAACARSFSTTALAASSSSSSSAPLRPPPPTPLAALLPTRSVLEVSGPDAQKFLNGQMCKNVESLGGGYSGFLNASGRVLHTVFSIPAEPTKYLIAHESLDDHPAPLAKLLPPFRLRSKVRIRDVSDSWDVWAAWGQEAPGAGDSPVIKPDATWRFGSGGAAERLWSWEGGVRASLGIVDTEVGCWDLRAGWGAEGMGRRVFVPKGEKLSLLSSHDLATLDDYTLHRMLLGVPEGSTEIVPGQALPLESCMDVHSGVDFRKGCYLGQELTVRTYHTGATRKRILPIRLFPLDVSATTSLVDAASAPGPSLTTLPTAVDVTYTPPTSSASKKTRSAGRILSLHPTASNVGVALVRLEFADRVWGEGDREGMHALTGSVGEYTEATSRGTLTAEVEGKKYGVYVADGEAYGAALAHLPPPPPPTVDDE